MKENTSTHTIKVESYIDDLGYLLGFLTGFIWKESAIVKIGENENEELQSLSEKFQSPNAVVSLTDFIKIERRPSINLDIINNENLLCPISNCLMTDPYIITKCGHTFQKSSLMDWYNKKQNCPICRIIISDNDYKPNFMMKSLIEDLLKEMK